MIMNAQNRRPDPNPSAASDADRHPLPLARADGGGAYEVVQLDPQLTGPVRQRLLDLGLTPGATVRHELSAPFRGTRAYRIRGALIALRDDLARHVHVQPADNDPRN